MECGVPDYHEWNMMSQTHHEWSVVSQSQKPEPHAVHNVDHARHTSILAKGHHTSPLCIHHLLVVYQTNALKKMKNNMVTLPYLQFHSYISPFSDKMV